MWTLKDSRKNGGCLARQCVFLSLLSFLVVSHTGAVSFYFPSFGEPVLSEKHLFVTEAGPRPARLMCFSRESGEKLWEIQERNTTIIPWFVVGDRLVLTKSNRIYTASLQNGRTRRVYRTGLKREFQLIPHGPEGVLVMGENRKKEYVLTLVDLERERKVWQARNISWVVARGNGVLLCMHEEIRSDRRIRTHENQKLQALSEENGRVLWETDMASSGVAVGHLFVVYQDGMFVGLEQQTGEIVATLKPTHPISGHVHMIEQNGQVLVKTRIDKKMEIGEGDPFHNLWGENESTPPQQEIRRVEVVSI